MIICNRNVIFRFETQEEKDADRQINGGFNDWNGFWTSVNSHPAQAKNSAARAAVYEKSRSDEIQKTETQEKETGMIELQKIELQKIWTAEGGNTEEWESGGGGR